MPSALRKRGLARSKKTGRTYRVNIKRSRAAKKGARTRLHKKLKPQTRMKISRTAKKTARTKRTKSGRRVITRKKSTAPKKRRATTKSYSAEKTLAATSTFRDHK